MQFTHSHSRNTCKIFVDSGNPDDTRRALLILSEVGATLDGQTTNPSLVAKNPEIQKIIQSGRRLTQVQLLHTYKTIIQEISSLIPHGSVSIEVYADASSTALGLLDQAYEMNTWAGNAHIKFPITLTGLEAAHLFVEKGGKANMTLGFTQAQALAVDQATRGIRKGDVFYSSFIGRVFDNGFNGVDLLKNIIKQYKNINSPVEVLAASFRNLDQLKAAITAGCDIVTIPPKLLEQWHYESLKIEDSFVFADSSVHSVPDEVLGEGFDWHTDLVIPAQTVAGVDTFARDWNALLS